MSKTLYIRNTSRRDPFREFDGLVKAAFAPQVAESRTGFTPVTESYRDGDDAVVRLELPGVDVAAVDVEVVDGRLVVSGERPDPRAEAEGRRFSEFRYGAFKRSFRLGRQVGAEQVSASYDAGVLTVRVAGVYAEVAGQKIAISTSPVVESGQVVEVGEDGGDA